MITYVLESETGAILDEHLPAYCYAEIAQREANERNETICAYAIDSNLDREEQSDEPPRRRRVDHSSPCDNQSVHRHAQTRRGGYD